MNIRRISDISASQGHVIPTAMTFRHGSFYVGALTMFPLVQGTAHIYKIRRSGWIRVAVTGLTHILGVAFSPLIGGGDAGERSGSLPACALASG